MYMHRSFSTGEQPVRFLYRLLSLFSAFVMFLGFATRGSNKQRSWTAHILNNVPALSEHCVQKDFPHPAVSIGQVKPIEIGGCRISASGKLLNFPFEDSGSALFWRVGSTTL